MARGISEDDVWKACDALLLEGARPTIERVRQRIGSGSPNTVSPHLDAWFKHLGGRLKDPGAFSAPPGVPEAISQAARHFWEVALAETRKDFDDRLRERMAAAVANVEAEKERARVADASAFEAASKVVRLQAEVADQLARLEQAGLLHAERQANLADAQRQIEELKARLERAEAIVSEVRESADQKIAAALQASTRSKAEVERMAAEVAERIVATMRPAAPASRKTAAKLVGTKRKPAKPGQA